MMVLLTGLEVTTKYFLFSCNEINFKSVYIAVYMVTSEKQLIQDCLKGNQIAQRGLYQLYSGKMLGICYRYTKTIEDAEDVLQEGFIKVFTRIHQFAGDGNFLSWITTIMVNTAIDYLHKRKKYSKDLNLDDLPMYMVSDNNPEIDLDTKDLVEHIRNLPLTYQLVFNLVAIEGYSQMEVASLLKININTIRSRYSRARAMLIVEIKKNELPKVNAYAK